ncbi:hypothetical protein [Blastococcus sp. VKM Ac-2987]|uniref:hypothetical protein n=1 Tax=Blastococcus sp. VKM Ac-2987 TaxID=3004141 RepID=UPI0022AB5F5F|nr:hypothetical protein [Blastococcus sp. VKM Ac-2987]MCZ2860533.1 hypothetical protein [Blastococcus sp. VKM Ac-2987]
MSTATQHEIPTRLTGGDLPAERGRPNVTGDLPTLFRAEPMFARALAGYDRFQVDTYVQWAEDELATAEREREHLLARCLDTQAALTEARELLDHSAGGGEFLRLSDRMGSMLAAAADQAAGITAEAEAVLAAAQADAEELTARAAVELADAGLRARQTVAAATEQADGILAAARRALADAEQARRDAAEEAAARVAQARAVEQAAAEHAALLAEQAAADVAHLRLQGRDEVVRMLATGREERRRADAAAEAERERLDAVATGRRAALLADLAALEHRRSALEAELRRTAGSIALPTEGPRVPARGRLLSRLR